MIDEITQSASTQWKMRVGISHTRTCVSLSLIVSRVLLHPREDNRKRTVCSEASDIPSVDDKPKRCRLLTLRSAPPPTSGLEKLHEPSLLDSAADRRRPARLGDRLAGCGAVCQA